MNATMDAEMARGGTSHPTGQRVGYVVAIAINGVLLYVVRHLVDWGWPGFVTADFDDVVPIISTSLVAGMVANACFVVHDHGAFRALADAVTAAISLVATAQIWTVFPFDLDGGWRWLVRALLVIALVGTAVAVVVNLGKLAARLARAVGSDLPGRHA